MDYEFGNFELDLATDSEHLSSTDYVYIKLHIVDDEQFQHTNVTVESIGPTRSDIREIQISKEDLDLCLQRELNVYVFVPDPRDLQQQVPFLVPEEKQHEYNRDFLWDLSFMLQQFNAKRSASDNSTRQTTSEFKAVCDDQRLRVQSPFLQESCWPTETVGSTDDVGSTDSFVCLQPLDSRSQANPSKPLKTRKRKQSSVTTKGTEVPKHSRKGYPKKKNIKANWEPSTDKQSLGSPHLSEKLTSVVKPTSSVAVAQGSNRKKKKNITVGDLCKVPIDLQVDFKDHVQSCVSALWPTLDEVENSQKSPALIIRETARDLLRRALTIVPKVNNVLDDTIEPSSSSIKSISSVEPTSSVVETEKTANASSSVGSIDRLGSSNEVGTTDNVEYTDGVGTIDDVGTGTEDNFNRVELSVWAIEQALFDNWFIGDYSTYARKVRHLSTFLKSDPSYFQSLDPCYVATMSDRQLSQYVPPEESKVKALESFMQSNTMVEGDAVCRNPKCRARTVNYYTKQIRGADEPETRFFTCVSCGTKWKEN